MITKYGEIEDKEVILYLDRLTNRVFKILPMSEEECETIDKYVESLGRELFGNSKILFGDEILAITGTLKGLDYSNHKSLKSDIFKIIDIIDRVKERVS